MRASAAKRARMILLAADGVPNQRIAELVGASHDVIAWSERYLEASLSAPGSSPQLAPLPPRPRRSPPYLRVSVPLTRTYGPRPCGH